MESFGCVLIYLVSIWVTQNQVNWFIWLLGIWTWTWRYLLYLFNPQTYLLHWMYRSIMIHDLPQSYHVVNFISGFYLPISIANYQFFSINSFLFRFLTIPMISRLKNFTSKSFTKLSDNMTHPTYSVDSNMPHIVV